MKALENIPRILSDWWLYHSGEMSRRILEERRRALFVANRRNRDLRQQARTRFESDHSVSQHSTPMHWNTHAEVVRLSAYGVAIVTFTGRVACQLLLLAPSRSEERLIQRCEDGIVLQLAVSGSVSRELHVG